jgi:2-polyprenyl-3-methyl-5-hydroxy-6-metoxy-1,4-benzoquinol methylase
VDYDPVKDRLGSFFWRTPARTKLFYRALDTVFLRSWYVRRTLRALIGAAPAGQPFRVLDAGTGFGQYAYWLVKTFPQVTVHAVDIKDDYLERARHFLAQTPYAARVTFGVVDLTQPMAEADAYDLFLSVDVMEHIEDDRAVFRNARQVLRAGGHIVVNTPSDQGGSGVTAEGEQSFIGEHVRDGYPLAELTEKLETAGLRVTEQTYTYGPYGSAAWQMLVRWPITALNATWASAVALPLYYAVAAPLGLALNAVDLRHDNATGTGLLVAAQKPADA